MGRLKRSEAPTFLPIARKAFNFLPWPHGPKESYTLTIIVRDVLHLAKTAKEARNAIKQGAVTVDGKIRRDPNFASGLMSVVGIAGKSYRIVPTSKGLKIKEIPQIEANIKPCKITGKKILPGGKIQLNLHDGSNIIVSKQYSTRNILLLKLPERKIEKEIEFREGAVAVVTDGKNAGHVGKIAKIEKIRGTQPNKIYMEVNGETLEFPEEYIFVVGDTKPAITI